MVKINEIYDRKTVAIRISNISKLVSIKYTSLRDDIENTLISGKLLRKPNRKWAVQSMKLCTLAY